jgi:hypothetical protein
MHLACNFSMLNGNQVQAEGREGAGEGNGA